MSFKLHFENADPDVCLLLSFLFSPLIIREPVSASRPQALFGFHVI